MPRLFVRTRSGDRLGIDAPSGVSVMEALRDAGVDELLAVCGGCCSCATCHVHVDSAHAALLPAMGTDEDELLDGSPHRAAGSRLSCQLWVAPELDGIELRIAEQD